MTDIFLKIYDYLRRKRAFCFIVLILLTILLVLQTLSLKYKEEISDFLPFDSIHQKALGIYQDISSSNKVFVIFRMKDTSAIDQELLTEAIDKFVEISSEREMSRYIKEVTWQVDFSSFLTTTDFIYNNIPYFLTEEDYKRMGTLTQPEKISTKLQEAKQMLMLPTGSLISANIQKDPLNLFSPILTELTNYGKNLQSELYNEYIFTPDLKKCIAIVTSPFRASETKNNKKLIEALEKSISTIESDIKGVKAEILGAPLIAVTNASQIKKDSILAVSIAGILILALLLYSFRNLKNLVLIAFSILFGWLFAMGLIALIHDKVSIIVLGIASVIIGIAVNYPLHFSAHLKHNPDVRKALKEIVKPLIIGNITTVGAFLCLIPLDSPALRDLGIFSSLMLVGTIIFVIIFLPQFFRSKTPAINERLMFSKLSSFSFESRRWVIFPVIILTGIFAYFSFYTSFDSNMQNINYMTIQQKEDLKEFQKMLGSDSTTTIYCVSEGKTIDAALKKSESSKVLLDKMISQGIIKSHKGIGRFLPSSDEQQRRLERWNSFWKSRGEKITFTLKSESTACGFQQAAFSQFDSIITKKYLPQDFKHFSPLSGLLFGSYIRQDSLSYSIVDMLITEKNKVKEAENYIKNNIKEPFCFDISGMNSAISNSLSNNFNYIGWACSLIVFIFLWISFGRLELSILSFLPMAVSWIWILGIMQIAGMQFNIVNVILATFIFGQGDDYTIFMTEGLIYEYAYRKKMLASYKNSIILSAIIMFVGIGSLIIAKHPALRSLAEITIVGMFSVVFMAYLLPPMVFNWLTKNRSGYREIPITIGGLIRSGLFGTLICLQKIAPRIVIGLLGEKGKIVPGISFRKKLSSSSNHSKGEGAIILCKCYNKIDLFCLKLYSPRVLVIKSGSHEASDERAIAEKIRQGYYLYFPGSFDSIKREIYSGKTLLPLFISGSEMIMPHGSTPLCKGEIIIESAALLSPSAINELPRVKTEEPVAEESKREISHTEGSIERYSKSDGYFNKDKDHRCTMDEITESLNNFYDRGAEAIASKRRNAGYYSDYIRYSYLYKGYDIERRVEKRVKRFNYFSEWIDNFNGEGNVAVINNGTGEFAHLFALVHKKIRVYAFEKQGDAFDIASKCSFLPDNLTIEETGQFTASYKTESFSSIFLLEPSEEDKKRYKEFNPIYIE